MKEKLLLATLVAIITLFLQHGFQYIESFLTSEENQIYKSCLEREISTNKNAGEITITCKDEVSKFTSAIKNRQEIETINKIFELADKGRFKESENLINNNISNYKSVLSYYYFQLAKLNELQNKKELAINFYGKSIKVIENEKSYVNLAAIYATNKNYKKSIFNYKKAITVNPESYPAYTNLISVYKELEDYSNALIAYKNAISIEPKYSTAYFNMGNAYKESKQYKKAIELFSVAAKIDPYLLEYTKKQDWSDVEKWINTFDDLALKQEYQATLKQLNGK